ncbi:MAG: energy-coupling factor transporter ATPase [Erysipelotrichaceae bacterium]
MSIKYEKVGYTYNEGTPFSYVALKDIDLEISEGKITAIIGETGSGKTTLVQHLNALLLPSSGSIEVANRKIIANVKNKDLKALRKEVGLVFQFPEYQLFEDSVEKDICFGPKNFGTPNEELHTIASKMIKLVGMCEEDLDRSPFDLSGGQKRRVAIAGILAMDPSILVLDEPTAGLDPQGSKDMMNIFYNLNKKLNKTVLLVSHDMEHVLNYCDEVIVINSGKVIKQCNVKDFFKDIKLLEKLSITPPPIIEIKETLNKLNFNIPNNVLTIEQLAKAIKEEVSNHE